MEKTIKMSLETARLIYKDCVEHVSIASGNYKRWLLENFTKEELEGKEGFGWEDSFSGLGFYISGDSKIREILGTRDPNPNHNNIFVAEKQALSALAFAQLSHIVVKYNEGKLRVFIENGGLLGYSIEKNIKMELYIKEVPFSTTQLEFFDKKDAEISLRVNRELWNQYWQL